MKKNISKLLILVLLFTAAAASYSQPNSDELKQKVMRAYDFFNTHDVTKEKASEFIADDYLDHTPDPGQKSGIDGFVQSFADFKKGFPDYRITPNEIIMSSDGKSATVLITVTGTNSGELMGMPPTGKSVNFTGIDYLKFTDNKCSERWGYFDSMTMMAQLGLIK